MEWDIKDYCSICKGTVKSSERIGIREEILDQLKCLIPNWSCSHENAATCLTCLEKIQWASTFKTSYLRNCQNNLLTKTGNSTSSVICEICKRICNQEDCIPLCDSVSETGANLIRYLSVELESKLQDDSQTCEVCHKSLLNFYSITNLLELVNRDNVDELDKCDMIDIKDIELIDNVSVVNSIKTEIKEKAAASMSCAIKEETEDTSDNEVFHLKQEEVDFKMESENSSEEDGDIWKKNEKNTSVLSNNTGCQTDHIISHKSSDKLEMFKCDICEFETKYKRYIKMHMLIHKNSDEVEMFKCEICNHKTKYKHSFRRHMIGHKNSEELEMIKCQLCDYKSKNKYTTQIHTVKKHVHSLEF